MAGNFPATLVKAQKVRADWVDMRDQDYAPGLAVLPDRIALPEKLFHAVENGLVAPRFGVRNQGATGRCVGYALANLIDIQRALRHLRAEGALSDSFETVSADMLYNMAYFHDNYPDPDDTNARRIEGIRTLRSGIKGFYHHGVCPDCLVEPAKAEQWMSYADTSRWTDTNREPGFPSVAQAKKAREIGLGAYFRIASILNHFHAALAEAETILVTADVHAGWLQAKPENGGVIPWDTGCHTQGTHAFVVTGYDDRGFHVLNSWGPEWGGYGGRAGVALWAYDDWAHNVVDAWVLRLGVHAPSAFDASVGEKGIKGVVGPARAGSTPCLELVGHYVHLDDGFKVTTGAYPSFSDNWGDTKAYLSKDMTGETGEAEPYKGLLVWIPGSFEGIKPAFNAAVRRKPLIKQLGLYPYNIFWCNSFVEKSMEVLQTLFEDCEKQAGGDTEHLDNLIETKLKGVGRAFWRDIEMSALRAVRGPHELPFEKGERPHLDPLELGYVGDFLSDLMDLKDETGCEVHIVAEGAGALVVHEMLSALAHDREQIEGRFKGRAASDCIDTLHLLHPAIGMPRTEMHLMGLMERMNRGIDGKERAESRSAKPNVSALLNHDAEPRARIYVPTEALEKRLHFGSYGKSILHLVARSFEDRMPIEDLDHKRAAKSDALTQELQPPRTFLGMARACDDPDFTARSAVYRLNRIARDTREIDRVSQSELYSDTTIQDSIFKAIETWRTSARKGS